jgi:hypothetical protein
MSLNMIPYNGIRKFRVNYFLMEWLSLLHQAYDISCLDGSEQHY